jgi:RNA polymerase sigma-70 factor, ECF subfamily
VTPHRGRKPGKGAADADHGAAPPTVTGVGTGPRTITTTLTTPAAVPLSAAQCDDPTLVVRAQEGDTRAFEVLVRRYQRQLYRLAVRMLGNRSDAEDAVQDAFVAAWRRLSGFRGDAAFSSWMYRIVINRCLKLLRARRPALSLDDVSDHPTSDRDCPEHRAESHDRAAALHRALQDLPADQRVCWLLRDLHGLSYDDIAVIVGTSPDSVRGRLYRARRTLAEVMTPWR